MHPFASISLALPEGQQVESGDVMFEYPDQNTLNIVAGDKAVINFNSFNIAANEAVRFIQPSAAASVLSRVLGPSPSEIAGTLAANGMLYLVNPNGIHFTPQAQVNVNTLIASTLDIATNNFINGNYAFMRSANASGAAVLNDGLITGNNIALMGSAVCNSGVIIAKVGSVHLASGDKTTVTFDSKGLIQVAINEKTGSSVLDVNGAPIKDAVANSGSIEAAHVVMSAKAAADIFENAVNQTGIVKATGVVAQNGVIRIVANNNVQVSGKLKGTVPEGDCPSIEVSSEKDVTVDSKLETEGNTSLKADNNIIVKADITTHEGNLELLADADLDGIGSFAQAQGTTISTIGFGDITIQSSGESTLANINSAGDLILRQGGRPAIFTQWNDSHISTNGSLVINRGVTLKAGSALYEIGMDWRNLGRFEAQTSTVSLVSDKTALVVGSNTFNNFTIIVPGKEVRFEPDSTQTITGVLTLKGDYGRLLSLVSNDTASPRTQWRILPQGETDIMYTQIGDCYNARGPPLEATHSSSLGNLTNFDLDPYWTGQGISSFWSDPDNWDTGTVPTAFDIITFDGITGTNPNKDSVIDSAFPGTVDSLTLNGYTGTLTIGRDFTLNNFTLRTPGQTIVFGAGTLTTVRNTLTIEGAQDNFIHLTSSIPAKGSEFGIYIKKVSDAQGNPYLEYLDVRYSIAYGPTIPVPAKHYYIPAELNIDWDDTHTWTGGGATNNASEGGNWGGTAPETDDSVIFNTGSKACAWDASAPAQLTDFSINSGYTGTITLGKGLTATGAFVLQDAATFTTSGTNYAFSAGSYSQSAGTFTGNGSTLACTGAFTLSGGTFTSTSATLSVGGDWNDVGGVFTHNSGTIDFTKSSDTQTLTTAGVQTYNNITHSGAGKLQLVMQYSGWSYFKQLTIDNSVVSTEDQTNFPLLIYFASDANLAASAQSDGDDIFFTNAGGAKLSHEIEKYTSSTGELWAWVKIPTLSHTTDTVLYLYYGNATCGDQSDAAGTWSNNYGGVWEMKEGSGATTNDSTSNNNDGTFVGTGNTWDTGKIGNAISFDGNGRIIVPWADSIKPTTGITVSVWHYLVGNPDRVMISMGNGGYLLKVRDLWFTKTRPRAYLNTSTGNQQILRDYTDVFNSWVHFTLTYDGVDTAKLYSNGALVATNTTSMSGSIIYSDDTVHHIAGSSDASENWSGLLDNITVSSTPRSVDWIATEYNNQNSPATYQTLGSQSANAFNVAGTLNQSGSGIFDANGSVVTATGLATVSAGTYSASTGAQTFNGGLTISGGAFTGSTGAVDVNGTLTLSSGALTAPAAAGSFNLSGDFTISAGAAFTHNSGTVIFDGTTSLTSAGKAFNNIQLGTAIAGGSLTLADQLDLNGNFSVLNGGDTALDLTSRTLLFGGSTFNLTNLDTLTSTGSTFTFDGSAAQSLTSVGKIFNAIAVTNTSAGGVTFADRLQTSTFTDTAAGSKLYFSAASLAAPHTISTTLTINGSSGNLIALGPQNAATTWYISPPAGTIVI